MNRLYCRILTLLALVAVAALTSVASAEPQAPDADGDDGASTRSNPAASSPGAMAPERSGPADGETGQPPALASDDSESESGAAPDGETPDVQPSGTPVALRARAGRARSGQLLGGIAVGFRLSTLEAASEVPVVSLLLETHYVFFLNKSKTVGIGPFVAIQPDHQEFLTGGALGVLLALRYSQNSNIGFAIGAGALITTKTDMVDMQVKSSPVVSPLVITSFRFF